MSGSLLAHSAQPCQKQPSTKMTARSDGNKKSGRPNTFCACFFQPRIPERTKVAATRNSVERLPRARTSDIRSERCSGVNESLRLTDCLSMTTLPFSSRTLPAGGRWQPVAFLRLRCSMEIFRRVVATPSARHGETSCRSLPISPPQDHLITHSK